MAEANTVTRRYWTLPDNHEGRLAEGGRRLRGERRQNLPDRPLVSVITVCWNVDKTIDQAIRSVLAQTYENIEYILVDGASSDSTVSILKKYQADLDYFVSEPDEGLYFAMNKGLELAQGEYVLFLNADDWYEPDTVAALVAARDYSGCDFVAALANYVNEDTGAQNVLRSMPFDHSQYLRMSIRHETMLVPASVYDRLGPYDTQYRILSDREYATRLFENGCTFYEVQRPLLNFRTSGISNTNIDLLRAEQDLILRNEFPFLSAADRKALNDHAGATPQTYIDCANANLDHPAFVKACRAFLLDHKANHGAKWQTGDISSIGKSATDRYPSVSVILPYYAAADTIRATLDSVLAQTLDSFEVICVNDCAIDDSQRIIDEFARKDPRIRHIQNARNIGLGASRNAGIRAANGRYIFHIDPDDTIPPNALAHLYELAQKHGSTLVKGAFRAEQTVHGKPIGAGDVKYPGGVAHGVLVNTTLAETPALLHSTEGHWSALYTAEFATTTPYPTDLKMGQDSIFLVNAIVRAQSITLTPEVVYNYQVNANSAMNNFTARKCFDEIRWRKRAWDVLDGAGHADTADFILYSYWNPAMFEALPEILSPAQRREFFKNLGNTFKATQYRGYTKIKNPSISRVFDSHELTRVSGNKPTPHEMTIDSDDMDVDVLRIAAISTRDHGGAGSASKRCVNALRAVGQNAELHCYIAKQPSSYVKRAPLNAALMDVAGDDKALSDLWRERAVLTHKENSQLRARELFSKTGSVVDFREMKPVFDDADIIHFHWAVGMMDFPNAAEVIGDKPVVWTLHDMNPFTGGCHYAEGCDGFKRECKNCPLLRGSDLANEFWRQKKIAYGGLRNLHIVCPSQWLADLAAESTLFRDVPVHVIPNPLPVDVFRPTNKMTARQRLGLPLDKKLVLFGADSLANKRKGGDLLVEGMQVMASRGRTDQVEGVVFGASDLQIGVKTHSMGHVEDESTLALIYSAADVFAFPSREDNAPMTLAEAMLCGTPAVSFPVGNAPDLIVHRENGYIANYQDTSDFATGLEWALQSPRSKEMLSRSLQCHLTAKALNDPKPAARMHVALYRKIIEQSSNSNPPH